MSNPGPNTQSTQNLVPVNVALDASGLPTNSTYANGISLPLAQISTSLSGVVSVEDGNGTPVIFTNGVDPRTYGAKCDGKVVLDASISTGTTSVTVTSATAGFTAADVGKLCGVLNTSTTGPWSSRVGTVTGFTSSTTITVSLSGSSGALSNAQFAWGTEDTAAWTAAATAAGTQKLPLIVPAGISCVQNFTLPDRVPMIGHGADRSITWPWTFVGTGSTIMCLKWPGDNTTPVINCGSGNNLSGFNIDAFKTAAIALRSDVNGGAYMGHGKWSNMTIARAYGNVCQAGPAHSIANCTIWGQDGSDCVVMTGDGRVSDCDIYGAGTNYAAVRVTGHDVVLSNNHFWKNSTTNPAGPSVFYHPSATSGHTGNFVCTGNMFDTSVGPSVNIQLDGTATAHIVKITNNSGFQTDGVAAATYPFVSLTVAVGAVIRGFAVENNTAEPSFSGNNFGTYTYIVDGTGVAGHIYGSKTGGNVLDGAAALYAFSATWTGWDKNSGDIVIPYGGTAVTASTLV